MLVLLPRGSVCVDVNHVAHLFFLGNHFDAGPARMASIVHAFNYGSLYCEMERNRHYAPAFPEGRNVGSGGYFHTIGSTSGGDVSNCECVIS